MTRDELIQAFAEAVAKMEGYYLDLNNLSLEEINRRRIKFVEVQGKRYTVNQAYHNPGNIMGKWGNNMTSRDGFVIFPTKEAGWNALLTQISKCMLRKLTFYEIFAGQRDKDGKVIPGGYYGYAPAGHGNNNPKVYAQFVVDKLNEKFGTSWNIDQIVEDLWKI